MNEACVSGVLVVYYAKYLANITLKLVFQASTLMAVEPVA
jgi:hypothetical protein